MVDGGWWVVVVEAAGQGVAACGCKIGFNSENKFPVAFFIRHLNEEMSIYHLLPSHKLGYKNIQ